MLNKAKKHLITFLQENKMGKPVLERFLNLSFYSQSSNTSKDPSPKIAVRMGVEKKVMMASRTATPAVRGNVIS